MDTPSIPMKRCKKCDEEKPATTEWFRRNQDAKDGLNTACRQCGNEQVRQYYAENADKVRERHRQYRVKNSEKVRAQQRQYNSENPAVCRAAMHRYRALKRTVGGTHTAADIRLLLKSQNHKCWWCGKKIKANDFHVDHRIPLARGGSNAPENLCVACPTCNLSKGSKLPQEWNGRLL